jgi:hypothetical protein
MAQTTGFVQRLIVGTAAACAQIGPSPTNVELLIISTSSADDAATLAFKASMVDSLAAAMAARREVVATHDDNASVITVVTVNAV